MKDIKTRLIELVEKKWFDETNVASKNLQRFEDLRKKKDRTAEEKKMLIKLSKEYNEYRHKKLNCEKKLNDIISLEQKEYSYKDIINVWRRKEDKSVYEERKERIKNTAEKINSEIKNFNCSFERFNGKYNSYTNLLFDSVNSDMKRKYVIFNNIGNLIEPFVKANTNKKNDLRRRT